MNYKKINKIQHQHSTAIINLVLRVISKCEKGLTSQEDTINELQKIEQTQNRNMFVHQNDHSAYHRVVWPTEPGVSQVMQLSSWILSWYFMRNLRSRFQKICTNILRIRRVAIVTRNLKNSAIPHRIQFAAGCQKSIAQWQTHCIISSIFRTEKSLFLPPRIPSCLHILWTVGIR